MSMPSSSELVATNPRLAGLANVAREEAERQLRLYAVVGRLGSACPEVALRVGLAALVLSAVLGVIVLAAGVILQVRFRRD